MSINKITATFYEYPAAIHEIHAWEKSKLQDIESKFDLGLTFMYHLKNNEILIATPIHKPDMKLLEDIIDKHQYHKTLVFGKVNPIDLEMLSNFVNKHDAIKHGTVFTI